MFVFFDEGLLGVDKASMASQLVQEAKRLDGGGVQQSAGAYSFLRLLDQLRMAKSGGPRLA
eukprot:8385043-Pyramimonas_sp.AAC.1